MQRTPTHRTPRKLAQLKRALQQAGISQRQVAEAAGVVKPTVCHVLAGRYVSANVLRTAERLLAEKNVHAIA